MNLGLEEDDPPFETLPRQPAKAPTRAPAPRKPQPDHHEGNGTEEPSGPARPTPATPFVAGRGLPHSVEAEEYLLSCCLVDSNDVVGRCIEAKLSPSSFYVPSHGIVFEKLVELHTRGVAIDVAVLGEELRTARQLEAVGGYGFLTRVSGSIPTTAQAGYFIGTVADLATRRDILRRSIAVVEECYDPALSIEELLAKATMPPALGRRDTVPAFAFPSFGVPPTGDSSVLLGDRYLNRGDGLILSSTSGMGKSSMDRQMAACFALGRDFHGIRPNGPLTSLEIQAEDSAGDIGESWLSLRHAMKLTDEEVETISRRVLIVTERVRRGRAFLDELRRLVAKHKPDLVHINPLQSFVDGDITDAKDLSDFLAGGLNSINEGSSFGYIVVHHTTKPPQEKKERLWHEVMYDMAGGAQIINWARAIMSLRATGEPGEFNLVLAKRGTRAGVTKEVPQGAGFREEIVTTIPMKHSDEQIEIPGRKKRMRCIFWEPRTPRADEGNVNKGSGTGRAPTHTFSTFRPAFPKTREEAAGVNQILRNMKQIRVIGNGAGQRIIDEAVQDGSVKAVTDERGRSKYWLSS